MQLSRALSPLLAAFCLWGAGCSEASDSESRQAAHLGNSGPLFGVLSDDEPKHVLLIVIDTLRADHLGGYGYWRDTSPNMDGLGQRGVTFANAISQSSWTSPSMITMFTGQRLSSRRLSLPEEKPTLAELFKDAGYRTGGFVTNPLLNPENGFERGFDTWLLDPSGLQVIDPVKQWIIDRKDEDTFTWVHFTDPHDPYEPPASARSEEFGRVLQSTEDLMHHAIEQEGYKDFDSQRARIASDIGRYDDEIVAVDRKLRELVGTLQEIGRLDNSIVVITSDHGECLWQRFEAAAQVVHQTREREKKLGKPSPASLQQRLKQTHGTFVFQELVRVPLIISAPGLAAGSVVEELAESVHLAPTILALAGIAGPEVAKLEGKNLFGLELPGGAYAMTDQGEAFLTEDLWKLILPTEIGREAYGIETQLYYLPEDPGELTNRAPSEPERVARMTALLEARRALALPGSHGESWAEVVRRNAQTLRDLGYMGGDGGFLDQPAQPDQK